MRLTTREQFEAIIPKPECIEWDGSQNRYRPKRNGTPMIAGNYQKQWEVWKEAAKVYRGDGDA